MLGADHTRRARTSSEPGDDTGRALRDDRLTRVKEATVSVEQLEEMGPIDYIVIEWPGRQPTGDAVPLIVDIAFMVKGEDGSVAALDIGEINGGSGGWGEFDGASSGLLGNEDIEEAAAALEPGTSAAVLVWENRWAAPVAVALRKSGGQLVASGRLPIQAILASLEAAEATN
jgi:hypothetical protein